MRSRLALLKMELGSAESQLWCGNIPPGHSEQQALSELAAYDVFCRKIVLRSRTPPLESWGILYFASPELAMQALTKTNLVWSTGKHLLLKKANPRSYTKQLQQFQVQQQLAQALPPPPWPRRTRRPAAGVPRSRPAAC